VRRRSARARSSRDRRRGSAGPVRRGQQGHADVVREQIEDLAGEPVPQRIGHPVLGLAEREPDVHPVHELGVHRGQRGGGQGAERVVGQQAGRSRGDQRAEPVLDGGPEALETIRQGGERVVDRLLHLGVGHHRRGHAVGDPRLHRGERDADRAELDPVDRVHDRHHELAHPPQLGQVQPDRVVELQHRV
jgi:hypothetical protein